MIALLLTPVGGDIGDLQRGFPLLELTETT
jgi:hypothetical protein